MPLYQGW